MSIKEAKNQEGLKKPLMGTAFTVDTKDTRKWTVGRILYVSKTENSNNPVSGDFWEIEYVLCAVEDELNSKKVDSDESLSKEHDEYT